MNVLAELLDTGAAHDASYGDAGFTNHLPMALCALRRLGASDERLRAFAGHYARRLRAAPPPQPWPAGDAWTGRFGDAAAWPAYRTLFRDWLAHEGGSAVLGQALPALLRGAGAAAFHGLIRSSYAVQAGHAGELADGLAYWASTWLPLEPPVPPRRPAAAVAADLETPADALAALKRALRGARPAGALISERMADAAAMPGFARAVARLQTGDGTLEALARHAAALYAASGDFTVLHLVTSAHALRELLPATDDAGAAVAHYWRAYAAGAVASGVANRVAKAAAEPPPWPAIVTAAVASDDDHVIKLVDSAREHERVYGDGPWRAAAARAVAG